MFPTANSQVYRNEAGEVLGWDNPGYDDGPDPDDYYDQFDDGDYDQEPVDEQYGDDGDLRDHYGDPSEADSGFRPDETDWRRYEGRDHQCDDECSCTRQGSDDEPEEEEPEPREPDDDEVSWQEYGRAEAYADGIHEQGYGE
jgi:hypothetical protein